MASEVKDKGKKNIFARIGRSVRDMRGEMKKVVWPTKKQTLNNTAIVLVFMLVMAIVIGIFDTALSALIALFVSL